MRLMEHRVTPPLVRVSYIFVSSVWIVSVNKEQGEHTDKSAGHFIILFSIKICPQQH